jgi:hypothetical protein
LYVAYFLQVNTERPPRSDSRQTGGRQNDSDSTTTHSIPKKYYFALADQQNLIRQIRNAGGFLSIPQPAPARGATRRPATNGTGEAAKSARIDTDGGDDNGEAAVEGDWELRENYTEGGDEELNWVVRAKDEGDLAKASGVLLAALEKAKSATHSE